MPALPCGPALHSLTPLIIFEPPPTTTALCKNRTAPFIWSSGLGGGRTIFAGHCISLVQIRRSPRIPSPPTPLSTFISPPPSYHHLPPTPLSNHTDGGVQDMYFIFITYNITLYRLWPASLVTGPNPPLEKVSAPPSPSPA